MVSKRFKAKIEEYIGRELNFGETIHHLDGNHKNNSLNNIHIFRTGKEHQNHHSKINKWAVKITDMNHQERIQHMANYPNLKSNLEELRNMDSETYREYCDGALDEIIYNNCRILRPFEFKKLVNGIYKEKHRITFNALFYSGMRLSEMKRFQEHPEWFDGEYIHLPYLDTVGKVRKQMERTIRLNIQGKFTISQFITTGNKIPTYQTYNENLKTWARHSKLNDVGISPKSIRLTWESWLVFYYYPKHFSEIMISQGHYQIHFIRNYKEFPFTVTDKKEMEEYVSGWV